MAEPKPPAASAPDASVSGHKTSLNLPLPTVVGGMAGAGIVFLARTFARATGPLGANITSIIAGSGIYIPACVLQALAQRKPDSDAGVFGYASNGFGNDPSFISAFSIWIGTGRDDVGTATIRGFTTLTTLLSAWTFMTATLGVMTSTYAPFAIFSLPLPVMTVANALQGIRMFHITAP